MSIIKTGTSAKDHRITTSTTVTNLYGVQESAPSIPEAQRTQAYFIIGQRNTSFDYHRWADLRGEMEDVLEGNWRQGVNSKWSKAQDT